MPRYRYLTSDKKYPDRKDEDILDKSVKREEIINGFVTWEQKDNCYILHSSYENYMKNSSGYAHEVIYGWQPQRIKFDIDYKEKIEEKKQVSNSGDFLDDLLNDTETVFIDTALRAIIDSICAHLFYSYQICATSEDMILLTSSGKIDENTYKHSYSIILYKWLVGSNLESAEFTSRVVSTLPKDIAKIVDVSVNKSLQNFRLIDQKKPEPNVKYERIKRMFPGGYNTYRQPTVAQTIIAPVGRIRKDERHLSSFLV